MLYKLEKYTAKEIKGLDAGLRKRINKIRLMSSNFSLENETARKLEDELYPVIHYQITGELITVEKTQADLEEVKKGISDFISEMKNNTGASVDVEQVEKIVDKNLRIRKFGFNNLNKELADKFKEIQVIKYDIPNVKTPALQNSNIPAFQDIVDDIMFGHNVFLIGGAGTGKTTLAEKVAEALGREYTTINCSQWTSPMEIVGGQSLDGYVEGKMIEAWKNGHMVILDEMPKLDPNTAGLLNDALAKGKNAKAFIHNSRKEKFAKHKNFCVIATGNIYPNGESVAYGANNKQDLSLLDRFSGSIYWIEKNKVLEKALTQNDMIWRVADKIRTVIEDKKYEAQMSLRWMLVARDIYNLEKKRYKNKGKNGVKHSDGKTLKKALDSYLSTFTPSQIDVIKTTINYDKFIIEYEKTLKD